jgi:acyl transferase domain-containing protein
MKRTLQIDTFIENLVVLDLLTDVITRYTAGALSVDSAYKVAYYRGQLAESLRRRSVASPGAMISVDLPEEQVRPYLKKMDFVLAESIHIACVNSPRNCSLSGPEELIDVLLEKLGKDQISAQKLRTGVAYHSPSMLVIAPEYLSLIGKRLERGQLNGSATTIPIISTITGSPVSPELLSTGQYWVDNLTSTVRFSDGLQVILQNPWKLRPGLGPITDLVEIGPHSALRRPVLDTIRQVESRNPLRYTSTLYRTKDALRSALELAGMLYCRGLPVSISAVNGQEAKGEHISLLGDCPEYPFDHSRTYWEESRLSRDYRLRQGGRTDMLGVRSFDWNPHQPHWRNFLSQEAMPWTKDHVVSITPRRRTINPGPGQCMSFYLP